MSPRFTVLMPAHNRADVIGFAIQSVLAQTESDFELLVVGDGCTDNTADVVAGFKDPRIRWFDLPKAPYYGYANRNVALKQSRGEYVAFLGHDDLFFPDHLATLRRTLDETNAEWAYSRPLWVSPDGFVLPLSGNLNNADELRRFLAGDNFIPAACIMHRRQCFAKYGYWREDVPTAADWHLWRKIIMLGSRKNFAYCPTPTTLHFKAQWKARIDQDMPVVTAVLTTAQREAWWPQALKIPISPPQPEQEIFSRLLSDPAENWVEKVRAAIPVMTARLAEA